MNENLIVDLDFTRGFIRDFSKENSSVTFNGSTQLRLTPGGWGYRPSVLDYIKVASNPNQLITTGTLFFFFYSLGLTSSNEILFAKRDSSGTVFQCATNSGSTAFYLYDGSHISYFPIGSGTSYYRGLTVYSITINPNQKPKLYVNGSYFGEGSTVVNLPTSINPDIYIGNKYVGGNPFSQDILGFKMYNKVLTASEISRIYYKLMQSTNWVKNRSYVYTSSQINSDMPHLVSGWNLNHLAIDVKGVNNCSLNGHLSRLDTDWGEEGLYFADTTAYLTAGSDNSLNFTNVNFAGFIWVKVKEYSNSPYLMTRGGESVNGYLLGIKNTGYPYFSTNQSGNSQEAISSIKLKKKQWVQIGFFSESGGNNYIYLNSKVTGTVQRIDPSSATRQFLIGRFFRGGLSSACIFSNLSKTEFERQLRSNYSLVSNKVVCSEPLDDLPVSSVPSSTAGSYVYGSTLKINSGSFKIVNPFSTSKAIEGVVSGSECAFEKNSTKYGSYFLKIDHLSNEPLEIFLYSDKQTTPSTFLKVTTDNNKVNLFLNGTSMFESAESLSSGVHEIRVDLSIDEKVRTYLDNVLLTASSGSNPFTDSNSIGSSKYVLFRFNQTGSKIMGFVQKQGVIEW